MPIDFKRPVTWQELITPPRAYPQPNVAAQQERSAEREGVRAPAVSARIPLESPGRSRGRSGAGASALAPSPDARQTPPQRQIFPVDTGNQMPFGPSPDARGRSNDRPIQPIFPTDPGDASQLSRSPDARRSAPSSMPFGPSPDTQEAPPMRPIFPTEEPNAVVHPQTFRTRMGFCAACSRYHEDPKRLCPDCGKVHE